MTLILSLLAKFWPYVLAACGVAAAFVTRWWTNRTKAADIAKAQADTAEATRQQVATESQAATDRAVADAVRIRTDAEQQSAATAAQGDDAINASLAAKGALRD